MGRPTPTRQAARCVSSPKNRRIKWTRGGDANDIGAPLATYKIESLPRIVDLVTQAEGLLNDHLIDNTEEVFEELPDIDTARAALNDALDLIGVGETTK